MDILREMMIESVEKKMLEFMAEKEVYEYNELQLRLILEKLNNGEELNATEKKYLQIVFDN